MPDLVSLVDTRPASVLKFGACSLRIIIIALLSSWLLLGAPGSHYAEKLRLSITKPSLQWPWSIGRVSSKFAAYRAERFFYFIKNVHFVSYLAVWGPV